jgi:hypothetical protein
MEEFGRIPDGSQLFAESLKKTPPERHPDFGKKKGEPTKVSGGNDIRMKRVAKN